MAESKSGMTYTIVNKVDQLRPGTSGHTITVKVVNSKKVMQRGRPNGPQMRQMRLAECLVGDETGMIVFTARNDQGILCTSTFKLALVVHCLFILPPVLILFKCHNFFTKLGMPSSSSMTLLSLLYLLLLLRVYFFNFQWT